jgi:pantetheine-phosphate adenylyltransferase/dephospho-CoA kinase
MKIVITGGIGSGKSTVTELFHQELSGFKVLSVDKLVAKMYDDPMIGDQLIERLGTKEKKDVSDIVFRNAKLREAVEKLFASQINLAINHEIELNQNLIIEFPLLFEKGGDIVKDFHCVISVIAPEKLRVERVIKRNNFSREKIESIMDAQVSDEERSSRSDFIVVNDIDDIDILKKKVTELASSLRLIHAQLQEKRIGLFAGSFDPITLGHQHVIKTALSMVDFLIIGISNNSQKQGLLDVKTKESLIKSSLCEQLEKKELDKVIVLRVPEKCLTVNYAKRCGVKFLFRGLRTATDLEYENQINLLQKKIAPEIETVYLITPRELIEISSSLVKSVLGFEGWEEVAANYVSKSVLDCLKNLERDDDLN